MTRLALEPTDRLVIKEVTYRYEERLHDHLQFRADGGGPRLTITDEDLADRVANGEARLVRGDSGRDMRADLVARRVGDFSLRLPEERERARTKLTYVDMARALPPRSRSDAALLNAITETAARIGDTSPPTPRHLRRLMLRGGENPTASSYVPAHAAKGNRTDRLDIRIREIVEGKIDEVVGRRQKVAVTTIHQRVLVAVEDLNETLPAKLPCPSYETVKRALQARSPRDLMAAREGKPAAAQAFDGVVTRKGPMKPLEVVELDHTLCDLFVIEETTFLPMGRPTIVVALDRATRMPFGMHVGFDPPSVSTVMQCLRNGMLPKTYLDRKVRDGEWKIKNRWEVCGKPKTLLVDLARENVGNDLDDAAAEIKFHLRFAPGKSGKTKGALERFLKTLNYTLLHEQRGTTFANVLARGDYDPAKNAVITFDELLHVLHRWLLDVYACGKHMGIKDVPARLFKELEQKYPVDPVEDVYKLNMLFGRVDERTLQKTGLLFEYIVYYSPELVALLADPEFRRLSPDRRIKFRYDPADLECIRVYDPARAEYVVVPACERDREYATGLSIWQHRIITPFWQARLKANVDYGGIARAKVEIAQMFENAWKPQGKIGSRKRAAHFDGVGRLAMAGSDEATSPAGSADHTRRASAAGKKTPGSNVVPLPQAVPDSASVAPISRKGAGSVSRVGEPGNETDLYAEIGIRRTG